MLCPKCKLEMEFEELKNYHGIWICCECDKEYDGSKIPCESDGFQITDCNEELY